MTRITGLACICQIHIYFRQPIFQVNFNFFTRALLPGFCNNPVDLKESFKGMARTLGEHLQQRKELRLDILVSTFEDQIPETRIHL